MQKALVVLLGPTGVGKTDMSIALARHFGTPVVSCDSRQMYREMRVGTAVPSADQLEAVRHLFIQTLSVTDYYNAWQFEQQALAAIAGIHRMTDVALMVGGSMMYIDAVCKGIDDIPTISKEVRDAVQQRYNQEGIESLRRQLRELDPVFYGEVDLNNAKRVLHAVEVCVMAGKPYSSLRTNMARERGFKIVKIGLNCDRQELYDRINRRVDAMLAEGLEAEARALLPYRHLNPLNTVGYKEMFDYFDGRTDYGEAVRLIKRNTRHYARKQMSWFRRDQSIHWFHPQDGEAIVRFLEKELE